MFGGFFGGRKRSEQVQRTDPAMHASRAPAMQAPMPQPSERAMPVPQQPAAQAAPVRQNEQRPQAQAQPPADDLFAGVEDSERFEIPAFLRRQAKTGS
jgi:hypothetical protein